ncbi:unnamed protein product [Pleuronectes platessa]|uniref:Uncharacterized protein n=1 Tax=Pleuronectes platessa TaxID=8262 RepID=A0A9N7TV98_PLEPL|nr:unnamed protein product [Pleuronectes platessa]
MSDEQSTLWRPRFNVNSRNTYYSLTHRLANLQATNWQALSPAARYICPFGVILRRKWTWKCIKDHLSTTSYTKRRTV